MAANATTGLSTQQQQQPKATVGAGAGPSSDGGGETVSEVRQELLSTAGLLRQRLRDVVP
jgi:hypothetical protein